MKYSYNRIKDAIGKTLKAFSASIIQIIGVISASLIQIIRIISKPIIERIRMISEIISVISKPIIKIIRIISEIIRVISKPIIERIILISEIITAISESIVKTIKIIRKAITEKIKTIREAITERIQIIREYIIKTTELLRKVTNAIYQLIKKIGNSMRSFLLGICFCGFPAFIYILICTYVGQYVLIYPPMHDIGMRFGYLVIYLIAVAAYFFSVYDYTTFPLIVRIIRKLVLAIMLYLGLCYSMMFLDIAVRMALLYLEIPEVTNYYEFRLMLNPENQLKYIRAFRETWQYYLPAQQTEKFTSWMTFESWAVDSRTKSGVTVEQVRQRMNDALAWVNYIERKEIMEEQRMSRIGRIGFVSTLPRVIANFGSHSIWYDPVIFSWYGQWAAHKLEWLEVVWRDYIDATFEKPFKDQEIATAKEAEEFYNAVDKNGTLWRDHLYSLTFYTGKEEIAELRKFYGVPENGLYHWRPHLPTKSLYNSGYKFIIYEPFNPTSFGEPRIWKKFHEMGSWNLNPWFFPGLGVKMVPMDPHFFVKGPFRYWLSPLGHEWIQQAIFQWFINEKYPPQEIFNAKLWTLNYTWHAIDNDWITFEEAKKRGMFNIDEVVNSIESYYNPRRMRTGLEVAFQKMIHGHTVKPMYSQYRDPLASSMSLKYWLDHGYFKHDDIDIAYFINNRLCTHQEALDLGFSEYVVYPNGNPNPIFYGPENEEIIHGFMEIDYAIRKKLISIEEALKENLITEQEARDKGFL